MIINFLHKKNFLDDNMSSYKTTVLSSTITLSILYLLLIKYKNNV